MGNRFGKICARSGRLDTTQASKSKMELIPLKTDNKNGDEDDYDEVALDAAELRMCMEPLDCEEPEDPEEIRLRGLVRRRMEKSKQLKLQADSSTTMTMTKKNQ